MEDNLKPDNTEHNVKTPPEQPVAPQVVRPKTDNPNKPSLLKRWPLWVAVGLVAIAVGAALDYRVYSDHKFNALVSSIQSQELQTTRNTIKVGQINTDINNSGSSASASPARIAQLQNELASYKQLAANSCNGKATELTSQKVDSKVSRLWLTSSQKAYVAGAKTVLDQLSQSINSNDGICKTSGVVTGIDENFIKLLPGLVVIQQIQSNPNPPTAQQMQTLQTYTTASVTNKAALQKAVPGITAFFGNAYALYADFYNEVNATQAGNQTAALSYATKVNTEATAYSTTANDAQKDVTKYDSTFSAPTIKAAKSEIALIDAQKGSKIASQLDYGVPVFWLVDTKLGQYSDTHSDNPTPKASSTQQLVTVLKDSDVTSLNTQGLLKKTTYTSLGTDNSGYNLSVTLNNGYVLTDNTPPSK